MAISPRAQFARPHAFGRLTDGVEPAPGVDRSDRRFRSALLQHSISLAVHDALVRSGKTLGAVLEGAADSNGLSEDRLRRVLRGESGTQFTDLVFWADQFPEVASRIGENLLDWSSFGLVEDTGQSSVEVDPEADGPEPIKPHELAAFRKWQQHNLAALQARASERRPRGTVPRDPNRLR